MFPDFSRPPIRPYTARRRWLAWLGIAAFVVALGTVTAIVLNTEFGLFVSSLALLIVAIGHRFVSGASSAGVRRDSDYDTPDLPREADREEAKAHRLWRQRRVTRFQYERVIARHRLAHREISQEEFERLIQYIDDAEAGKPVSPGR